LQALPYVCYFKYPYFFGKGTHDSSFKENTIIPKRIKQTGKLIA
jgi:hypothetical protein